MEKEIVAKALGKIPSGLFVITAENNGEVAAFTGSFLVQAGFEPPLLALSVNKKSSGLEIIKNSGKFGVNILRDNQLKTVGFFARPKAEGDDKFGEYAHKLTANGTIILEDCLAWLSCQVFSSHEAGDHELILGEIVAGELTGEGSPATHVRKNGFNY